MANSLLINIIFVTIDLTTLEHLCNGLNVAMNRTSSVPKSVLHYELDKDSTLNWKLPLTNLVPQ